MKVLILTSFITGRGHASITSALEDELNNVDGLEYKTLESFDLCSKCMKQAGDSYGAVTRNFVWLWKITWSFTRAFPKFFNYFFSFSSKKKFLKVYNDFQPDIIISAHPMFNGNILGIMQRYGLKAKFVTVIADLVSVSPLWIDRRADLIFAPTTEAVSASLIRGVYEEKIVCINLPVRGEILKKARQIVEPVQKSLPPEKLSCLVMSGGEGSGNISKVVDSLLKTPIGKINVVTGNNKKLCERLSEKFKDCADRVKIYGFVNNMQELLSEQDIAVVRGSPNVLMECISCVVPIIITSTLPGQEVGNINYIVSRRMGLYAPKQKQLIEAVNKMIADDNAFLNICRQQEFAHRDLDSAKKIVDGILKKCKPNDVKEENVSAETVAEIAQVGSDVSNCAQDTSNDLN